MSGDEKAEGAMGKLRAFLCPAGVAKVLILGLIVRLAIAPWTYCPFDTYPFYSASVDMLAGLGMYGHAVFSYPPGFGFVIYPFMLLLSLFMDPSLFAGFYPEMIGVGAATGLVNPIITAPAFNLALKLPIIIGDVLVASMLFLMVSEWKGEKAGRAAYVLWFLNPLAIWIGSVVGQFDVLAVLCTLLAVHFFIHHRYALVGMSIGAGALLKMYPAYLGVLFLAYVLLSVGAAWKERLRSVAAMAAGLAISVLPALPLLFTTPEMVDYVLRRAGSDSFGGINLWFFAPLFGNASSATTGGANFIESPLFIMLVGLALTLIVSITLARSGRPLREGVITGSLLLLVIALLFRSLTNPQHLLWVIPFMIIFSLAVTSLRIPLIILTASGLLASLTLRSFAVFFYPMAAYTSLVSVEQLNSIVLTYHSWNAIPSILFVLSCLLGVLALLSILLIVSEAPAKWIRDRMWRARE